MNSSVVTVTFKSADKIFYNLGKIKSSTEIIIIENSNDINLKYEIEKKYENVKFIINENKGYGPAKNL